MRQVKAASSGLQNAQCCPYTVPILSLYCPCAVPTLCRTHMWLPGPCTARQQTEDAHSVSRRSQLTRTECEPARSQQAIDKRARSEPASSQPLVIKLFRWQLITFKCSRALKMAGLPSDNCQAAVRPCRCLYVLAHTVPTDWLSGCNRRALTVPHSHASRG